MARHKKLHRSKKPSMNREERKDAKRKKTMSLLLVFLMIASIFGIWASQSNQTNKLSYGDYTFTSTQLENGQYVLTTTVDKEEVFFYTLPQDVLRFNMSKNLTQFFADASIVIFTADPTDRLATFYDTVRFDMDQFSSTQIVGATPQPTPGINLPVLDCNNATTATPVLYMKQANETSFEFNQSCLTISVTDQEFAYVRDRLLFSLLGILNE